MEFERARSVLRTAERLVAREPGPPPPDGRWTAYADTVFIGPWLIAAGFRMLARRLGLTLVVAATIFAYFFVMDHKRWAESLLPALCYASATVYFGLPSRTVAGGVTSKTIDALAADIGKVVQSEEDLDRLSAGLAVFRTQKMERISRFNVLAGIGWAALFWYATSHVFAPGLEAKVLGDGVVHAAISGFAFIIILGVASAHAVAVRAVHQTVEFALLEAKRLQSLNQTTADPSREAPTRQLAATD